jgi:phosphopantothenoylcysteine decarboxylase/phosphopantothenate--cysteine ligase
MVRLFSEERTKNNKRKNILLQGKKVILGVCGSIAAYKAAFLVRLLVKSGADVQVVMTEAAKDFISPLTLATLSKKPVLSDFTANDKDGSWNNHVELGLWADVILIAPASAHSLAKFSHGICNDLLTAVYLSARCPVIIAPAMDLDMYRHPSTQANLHLLKQYGNTILEAQPGELASGLNGVGRMTEPEEIVTYLTNFFPKDTALAGKKVLLTAGPTQEAIDPVRYISNASSGKMGYALAEVFASRGAEVFLVSGPVNLQPSHPAVRLIRVRSAAEMFEAASSYFDNCDIAVFAAAVSDYSPKLKHTQKIKKTTDTLSIDLVKNVDIAQTLSKRKKADQFTVGFALETHDEAENAKKKLQEKNFNMIVLNSLNDTGAGFGYDTNKISIMLAADTKTYDFSLKSKQEVAWDIVDFIIKKYVA